MTLKYLTTSISTAAILVAMSLPVAAGGDVDLREPEHFSKETGELPARTAQPGTLGQGAWRADPAIHDGPRDTGGTKRQHLIYLQGGAPGPLEGGRKSYGAFGKDPRLLFPDPNNFNDAPDDPDDDVRISDLQSFSFDTKTDGDQDWFVDIFTKPDQNSGTNDAPWYQTNLDFTVDGLRSEPVENGFTRHTFDDSDSVIVNRDPEDRDKGQEGSGPFTYDEMKETFGEEPIVFVALGTATNYDGFDGYVDNFQFSYQNAANEVATRQIDLEPVPTPGTLGLLCAALVTAGALAGEASMKRPQGAWREIRSVVFSMIRR